MPAVTKDRVHLGASWALNNRKEINIAYVHAFNNSVYGLNSIPSDDGGGNASAVHVSELG